MKLSLKGREFIKSHEGLRLNAYSCSAGVRTIGYGHTGGNFPNTITQVQADAYFDADIAVFENGVTQLVKVQNTQSQFDALVSLAFNIGVGAFGKSTLLRKLNQGNFAGAQAQFSAWCKAGGKTNAGLLKRRLDEANMFGAGIQDVKPARPVRQVDAPPRQKPLAQSRTVIGAALAATGGAAQLGQALTDTSNQLTQAQEQASGGNIFGYVIAGIIIAGALLALYARISDAKRGT